MVRLDSPWGVRELLVARGAAVEETLDVLALSLTGGASALAAQALAAQALAAPGGTVVAYSDGVPVGSGGVTMADGVARLWGGGVVPSARGRGVYRAVLAARLEYATAHGATMALVKGRVETSGPILRRAGFAAYGQELIYKVPLD
ncbi:MAG TPA: GNAT family N-acetyltransferase [Trebonia sp.]|nr:GNAT family N-acetyltransferase [Trebonia sp.]